MDKIKVSVEVPKGEHPGWREHARVRGFDGNLAAYIRWLVRNDILFNGKWDSINAAPHPCYKKVGGVEVITHYVSFPWEDVQETRTHRGKPWYVYGNPWVWILEFKRIK